VEAIKKKNSPLKDSSKHGDVNKRLHNIETMTERENLKNYVNIIKGIII